MAGLLPLFPLQIVALPGVAVPLHIFEDRYKTMVGNCEKTGAEFGIVLAKDGGIVNAGCTVIVETVVERYPDGRFDIVTRGQRRFMLRALDQGLDWLRGEVEYFDDDDFTPVDPRLRKKAIECSREIREALDAAGKNAAEPEPDGEHPLLSFQLAGAVDDVDFRNVLLRSQSEAERLRKFVEFAEGYVSRTQYVAKMKRVVPGNGSGHKPADI
jgi:Lon protease-like protein